MPWLVCDGEVLASVETATTRRARRRGLIGRDRIDGVLQLRARSVHTFGMRMAIDVATCVPLGGDRFRIERVLTVPPWRITRPSWRASVVFEAEAGAFRSWGVAAGDELVLR